MATKKTSETQIDKSNGLYKAGDIVKALEEIGAADTKGTSLEVLEYLGNKVYRLKYVTGIAIGREVMATEAHFSK